MRMRKMKAKRQRVANDSNTDTVIMHNNHISKEE